jgi:putative sterol carrier protein
MVQKWGVTVINVEITLNSITRDENADNEDPALKSITSVFKSLFSPSSDTTTVMPGTSASTAGPGAPNPFTQMLPPELLSLFQNYSPIVVQGNNLENLTEDQKALIGNLSVSSNSPIVKDNDAIFSPHKLLQLITPHLNEHLVKEIQTVYEFHIKMKKKEGNNSTGNYAQEESQVFYLDLKNIPKGQTGTGNSIFSKADCIIKLSEEDLFDLLSDNLKPFTAYMSGRIEIDGDLQDVMKLKKLIKSITAVLPKK